MSYTPTTWTTGDTITASAMNKIENGIANAGGTTWDAVIRLTHVNNSAGDLTNSLTPTIVSGTCAGLKSKISNGGCPCILIEYTHQSQPFRFSAPMGYITYIGDFGVVISVAGYSYLSNDAFLFYGRLVWSTNDTIDWD